MCVSRQRSAGTATIYKKKRQLINNDLVWLPTSKKKKRNSTRRSTWEESRKQLADYKVKFLHTNVPQGYAENKSLGTWVNTQRRQYRLFKAGRNSYSCTTKERIQSLEELDFE